MRYGVNKKMIENNSEILIYQIVDRQTKIEVCLEDETVWLNQNQMAELFKPPSKISVYTYQNIFSEGELIEDSVVKDYLTTTADCKNYHTLYYNLDAIISVGYRINTHRGAQFVSGLPNG
jgi:hypothetical protein